MNERQSGDLNLQNGEVGRFFCCSRQYNTIWLKPNIILSQSEASIILGTNLSNIGGRRFRMQLSLWMKVKVFPARVKGYRRYMINR